MKHLVIIGLVIPEPASTAAGYRMMQLIKLFSEANYTITFLTSSNNIEFSEKIEIQKIDINNESFDKKIKELFSSFIIVVFPTPKVLAEFQFLLSSQNRHGMVF